MVDNLVTTDNYIVFSTTNVNVKGENRVVGFGAFGNVFLSDKLDLNALFGSENDIKKEKVYDRKERKLSKNENEFINNYEQNSISSASESYLPKAPVEKPYYNDNQNQISSTENTKIETGNFNCSPKDDIDVKILSSPDPNSIHSNWQNGVGTAWSIVGSKKITNEKGVFVVGDLISPRGSEQPNGPYYVILSEWSCATQISVNDVNNTSEINEKYLTVVTDKAYFYNYPNFESRSKSYLVNGEMSKVYSLSGDFVYTEVENYLGKFTKGWIRVSDINPALVTFKQ